MKISDFSKTDNKIFGLIKILLAACLAAPLFASASFIFPYTAPKVFAFRILVEIAAALYLYLALKYPKTFCHFGRSVSGEPESRPARYTSWFTSVAGAVLVFFAINLLSAIFGLDFYNSFWGSLERGGGVWGLAHFVAWFLMLSAVFKGQQDWVKLAGISVAVAVFIALTALIQRLGGWGILLPANGRVFGLIGNAGFFAGYALLNLFLAGYLFFASAGWQKWFFAISSLLLTISLLLSGTRGAWLGLAAGIIIFLFNQEVCRPKLVSGSSDRKSQNKFGMTKKTSWVFLAIIFVLIISLFLFRGNDLVKNNSTLYRLTHFSLSDATTQSRLLLWQGAWRAWQTKPILGFGPENFEAATGRYLSPRLAEFEAYATDRAHNFIFDYGVATGWLGLLAYVGIFIIVSYELIRVVIPAKAGIHAPGSRIESGMTENKKKAFLFSVIFLSLLAAYLVQNFFIFDSFVSYLMLFFVLAFIANITQSDCVIFPCRREISRGGEWSVFKKIILLLVVGYLLTAVYSFNFKPLLAAYRANQILSLPAENAALEAPLLKDALDLGAFGSAEIAYQASLDYIDKINQNPALAQNEDFYNIAAAALAKGIKRSPDQAGNYLALAWLDLYFSTQDRGRMSMAIDLGNRAKELRPNKKDAYLVLAAGYSLSGQQAKAQEIISQAQKIDGKMGEEVRRYWEQIK